MRAQVSLCQDGVDHYIRTEGLHAGPAGIDQHGDESAPCEGQRLLRSGGQAGRDVLHLSASPVNRL